MHAFAIGLLLVAFQVSCDGAPQRLIPEPTPPGDVSQEKLADVPQEIPVDVSQGTTDTAFITETTDATVTTDATDATDATGATGATGTTGATDATDTTDTSGTKDTIATADTVQDRVDKLDIRNLQSGSEN